MYRSSRQISPPPYNRRKCSEGSWTPRPKPVEPPTREADLRDAPDAPVRRYSHLRSSPDPSLAATGRLRTDPSRHRVTHGKTVPLFTVRAGQSAPPDGAVQLQPEPRTRPRRALHPGIDEANDRSSTVLWLDMQLDQKKIGITETMTTLFRTRGIGLLVESVQDSFRCQIAGGL